MKKIGTTIVIALMSVALLTACKSKADEEERFVSSGNYIAKIYLEEIDQKGMHRKCSFLYVRMAQNVRSCLSDGI